MSIYFQKIKAAVSDFFADSKRRYISIGALALLLIACVVVVLVSSLGKGQDVVPSPSDSDDIVSNDTVSDTVEQDDVNYDSRAGKALTAYSDGWIFYTVPVKCSPHYNETAGITYQSGMFYPDKDNTGQSGLFRVRPNGSEKQQLINRAIYDILVSGDYVYFATSSDYGNNLQSEYAKDLYKIRVDGSEEQSLCEKIDSSKYEHLNLTLIDNKLYYTVESDGLYCISVQGGEPHLADDLRYEIEYNGEVYTLSGYSALLFEGDKIYFNRTVEVQSKTGDIYDSFGFLYSKKTGSVETTLLCDLLGIDKLYSDGEWLYFVGYDEIDSVSGMYRDFGGSFLCRLKKDGSGFTKLMSLVTAEATDYEYAYARCDDIVIDDNYLYVYITKWDHPTGRSDPEFFDLYRMDKDGGNKTLLPKNGWDDAFEPSSAPASYFASNLTIHDGWIYTVLHERPFEGQVDTERYLLVRINAEKGVLEKSLPQHRRPRVFVHRQ